MPKRAGIQNIFNSQPITIASKKAPEVAGPTKYTVIVGCRYDDSAAWLHDAVNCRPKAQRVKRNMLNNLGKENDINTAFRETLETLSGFKLLHDRQIYIVRCCQTLNPVFLERGGLQLCSLPWNTAGFDAASGPPHQQLLVPLRKPMWRKLFEKYCRSAKSVSSGSCYLFHHIPQISDCNH